MHTAPRACVSDLFSLSLFKISVQRDSKPRVLKGALGRTQRICVLWWKNKLKLYLGTSLVVQWLGICLPMQGTWVRAQVREDPTCCGATKPVSHNCWAHIPQLLQPACLEPVLCNKEKPLQWEARIPLQRVALLAATRESLCTATKTQRSQ